MYEQHSTGPQTSTALLRDIRDLRNRDQWSRFVAEYTPYLVGILRRRGFPEEEALDFVQETFMTVVNHIGDFRYDPDKRFRGWLATIALRKAWRHAERKKRAVLLGDQLTEFTAGSHSNEDRISAVLARLHAAVSELEWRAFESTVLQDHTADEAAQQLGIARGYIYVCRSRAKKKLMELLEEGDE